MFGLTKPKSYLGIDVGASGIKLVELRQEKNRPVLFTYGLTAAKQDIHKLQIKLKEDKNVDTLLQKEAIVSVPVTDEQFSEESIAAYSDTIKKLCKASRVTSKNAVVSLPVSSVFHAVVTLPIVKKEELDHLLKAEVKKLLPVPLEEMALDFQVLSTSTAEKSQRVLVNAVPYKLIEFYSKVFAKAGLTLEALEPESTALTRCLIGKDQAVAMIVDIGSERTNFFIIDSGAPITHQTIESGGEKIDKILQNILGIEHELVERVKYDLFDFLPSGDNANISEQKWMEMLMPVLDPILKEIAVSLEVYLRQTGNEGKRPEKIILTGGMSLVPYLPKYIEQKFNIKCYVGDSWARVVYQDGLKPILRQIGPRLSVAIGLALRSVV